MSHNEPRIFHIREITLKLADEKASELYVVFSVKGRAEKEKTGVIATHKEVCTSWKDSVLEIEIPNPTKAELSVKVFSKRAVLADRLLGEFTLTLAHPGATANLSGELMKKGASNGRLSFKIYPKGNSKLHHGVVVTNRHSAYPGSHTLQQPGMPGQSVAEVAQERAEGVGEQAAAKTNAVAQEAEARSNAVTYEAGSETNATAAEAQQRSNAVAEKATGKTQAVVNLAEQKLVSFREDLLEGKHRPHDDEHKATEGSNQGQGAFSRTIGLPEDAGTAADGDHSIPYDSPSARGRDSVAGPVAPTGQGGLLSGTGAGATPVGANPGGNSGGTIRSAAVAATEKAEQALNTAKQAFNRST